MNNIWIIAQTGNGDAPQTITSESINSEAETATGTIENGANGGTTEDDPPPKSPFPSWIFLPLMLLMVFMLFRAPQKQKQEQKKLEKSLEKNDKVMTRGGIIGTIVDIKNDEITLKIDESNNTKMKVVRGAISRNMSKD